MDSEVIAALINAGATVLAATIGVAGVYAIVKHRRKVQWLSQQVEAYYHHEGELVKYIHQLENQGEVLTDNRLPAQRRQWRNRLVTNGQRPSMTARKAIELREQIL